MDSKGQNVTNRVYLDYKIKLKSNFLMTGNLKINYNSLPAKGSLLRRKMKKA